VDTVSVLQVRTEEDTEVPQEEVGGTVEVGERMVEDMVSLVEELTMLA